MQVSNQAGHKEMSTLKIAVTNRTDSVEDGDLVWSSLSMQSGSNLRETKSCYVCPKGSSCQKSCDKSLHPNSRKKFNKDGLSPVALSARKRMLANTCALKLKQ